MTTLPHLSIVFFLLFFSQTKGHFGNHAKLSSIESIKQLETCCEVGSEAQGLHQLKLYLARFGYLDYQITLDHVSAKDDKFDDKLEAALKTYQKYNHLNSTGTLDGPTVSQMLIPRCGLPDKSTYIHGSKSPHIVPHFKLSPTLLRWPPGKSHFTYAFPSNFPNKHAPPVDRAFKQWATATHYFTFSKIADFKRADLKVSFERRKHGDTDFDGPGIVLAHAFPPTDGRLHYDIEENWSDGPGPTAGTIDLESVTVHEIGHLFGLDHSDNPNASMFPSINYGVIRRLHADDINGIKTLYKLK
ncbi:metalloendoproteinase 1-like [Cynara cardunculus var. scolymus]|uniref:Metallopeptidase, catalytic domain-containing protein n=1 Tax=Cynara cardunculus var. scolymus TaxID=59895 RepID=A0A103XLB1_CYNCS|nr:metalloendoproteinase 1-like [Cynara cardunculus var. scolymus]KVH92768.1 Metallopeptidase, catalytic domain-containing protein [Cynara cardunculus var. scolymus]